jgi:hypothetical protein
VTVEAHSHQSSAAIVVPVTSLQLKVWEPLYQTQHRTRHWNFQLCQTHHLLQILTQLAGRYVTSPVVILMFLLLHCSVIRPVLCTFACRQSPPLS